MRPVVRRGSYREIISNTPSTRGWSWGFATNTDGSGRTIFVADYCDDGKQYVDADDKLTTFLELGSSGERQPSGFPNDDHRDPSSAEI
jgi:hypothetical protein